MGERSGEGLTWRLLCLGRAEAGRGGGEGRGESGRISEPRGICRLLSANMGTLPIGPFLVALPPALPSCGPAGKLPHPSQLRTETDCTPPVTLIPFFTPITHLDTLFHIPALPHEALKINPSLTHTHTPRNEVPLRVDSYTPSCLLQPPITQRPFWNYVLKQLPWDGS